MASQDTSVLTPEQITHFMRYGYVRLTDCFTKEKAAAWTSDVWTRLGFSPTDKSTWTRERTNMPSHKKEPVKTFAPKAWAAICELLGGEDRVSIESATWSDGLIVNLGTEEWEGRWPDPKELPGWHVDGDFFVHFLDSKEQGLLVIPLFTDIIDHAGGTMICPDGIGKIAKWLHDHPEGVSPRMVPRGLPARHEGLGFYSELVNGCEEFHEMTGQIGDVILLHPLMVHSASINSLRLPRIITNPPVSLNEPFKFDRANPEAYSIVERKTLQELGKDHLPEWEIKGDREAVVPERVRIQEQMKKLELERLSKIEAAQTLPRETAVA